MNASHTASMGATCHRAQQTVCKRKAQIFFFQAEGGIRGPFVTGVQTCSLPISAAAGGERSVDGPRQLSPAHLCDLRVDRISELAVSDPLTGLANYRQLTYAIDAEIGRGSCRAESVVASAPTRSCTMLCVTIRQK